MDHTKTNRPAALYLCGVLLPAAIVAAMAWYYDVYVHWQPTLFVMAVATVTIGVAALTLLTLWLRGERSPRKLLWKTALSTGVLSVAVLFGVSFLLNNVMHHGARADLAVAVAFPLAAAQILVLCVLLLRALGRRARWAAPPMAALLVLVSALGIGMPYYLRYIYQVPVPVGFAEGRFAPMPPLGAVDFRVPADGTIEEVRDRIRQTRASESGRRFTVLIEDGEYSVRHIGFDERDYGTTYRSQDGGAILNGGVSLDARDFVTSGIHPNIKVADLAALGLGTEDWGKLYAFGAYNTALKYDGGVGPLPCELFYNDRRCVTARYPNEGKWLFIDKVLDNGDSSETYENGKTVRHEEAWAALHNPRGGTFTMDNKTARRASGWASLNDVWMFGCFRHDWADMSTPVKAIEGNAVTAGHASAFGYGGGSAYYFFNVLEELDSPGEWYLDRERGLLYLWPPEGEFEHARIDLSLSTETLIEGEGLKDISFIGLTLQGTRGDGMRLHGDGVIVDHCVIRNVAGGALELDGSNNTVSNNEVYRVGKTGITIRGGDVATLTPGNSKAVNNLVHDWPEVVMTYQGGVNLYGTGNLAAHNELYNSPHTAMFFGGNKNVIEYNLIHDVCLETGDAGAIYAGRSFWSAYGTVLRYNAIYNVGGERYRPNGIYLDDGLAGVTLEGNLLVNVPGVGLAISGRCMTVKGNFVAGGGEPLAYDERTREGALADDPGISFHAHTGRGGDMWRDLEASPYQTAPWREAFPALAAVSADFEDAEDPAFAANPAGSEITDNVFAGPQKPRYGAYIPRFNIIEGNSEYGPRAGRNYRELPGYAGIPLGQIGRVGD